MLTQEQKLIKKRQKEQQQSHIKELLFSGGGGGVAFLLGYTKALIEIVGKEKLKEYKIGGVSCGCIVGALLHIVIHCDKYDIDYFYINNVRTTFTQKNKAFYGLLTNWVSMKKNAQVFHNILSENKEIPPLSGNVHCTVTVIKKNTFILKNKIIDELENPQDYYEALSSTCGIPFLINFGIFQRWKGRRTLDGGFTGIIPYKYKYSQKIYLNLVPEYFTKFPFTVKKPKNCKTIQTTQGLNMQFPRDYWIWDEKWADQQYQNGYYQAYKQCQELLESFQIQENIELKPSL